MTLGSHQATVGKRQDHLTPRFILDALGRFDLDPCAADPRPWDCADVNFTVADDGLAQEWCGRVWLNPPFDRYGIAGWIGRFVDHGRGTALVHVRTETEWFRPLWRAAQAMLFLGGRVIFCRADGSPCRISDPGSKHYGRPANSGAPVVLVALGQGGKWKLAPWMPLLARQAPEPAEAVE